MPKAVRVNVRLHKMGLTLPEIDRVLEQDRGAARMYIMRWLTCEKVDDDGVSAEGLSVVRRGCGA